MQMPSSISKRRFLASLTKASLAAALPSGIMASVGAQSGREHTTARAAQSPARSVERKLTRRFGLGGVAIGNGMNLNTDEECYKAMQEAWNAGVRLYDTSPWYGRGLSERRFGHFLFNKNREDYILTTKIGRLLQPDADVQFEQDDFWKGRPYFNYTYDYSASGARRSIEESLQRLGLPYIDYVFIHDLDSDNKDIDWEERFKECLKGAFPELSRMRDEGLIKGWGLGVNQLDPIIRTIEQSDPDIFLSAAQYSLIKHQDSLDRLLPLLEKTGTQVVLGGVLNSGYLAGTPRYSYKQSNVTPEIERKRDNLQAVAQRHGVDLRTAAIQFALSPDAVSAAVIGARNAEQVRQNVESLAVQIPSDFWAELKEQKLIASNAPVDYQPVKL